MSCAVFTFVGLYALMTGKSNAWLVGASMTAAMLLFLVSAFLAWNEEHSKRVTAEQRLKDEEPKIMFGLLSSDIDWSSLDSFGEYVFTLTNYGKRPAIYVHLKAISSVAGIYTLCFEDTDILPGNAHYHTISHQIDNGTQKVNLGKRMLWDFLHNCSLELQTETFEVEINFTDMDVQRTKPALMRFDLNTKKLSIDPN